MNRWGLHMRSWRSHRSGQSLVETALLLPVLTMLMIGVFEFGMLMYAHVQVANAAREAARAASLYRINRYEYVNPAATNIQDCATNIDGWSVQQVAEFAVVARTPANNGCPNSNGTLQYTSLGLLEPAPDPMWTVTVTPAQTTNANPTAGSQARVTLIYPYQLVILSQLVPGLSTPMYISKSVDFQYTQ